MRALVVDDSSTIRDIVGTILKRSFGFEVIEAANTAEALRQPGPFDLVVTDLVMPEEQGFSLIRELRSRDETRTVPILVISVEVHPDVPKHAVLAGADRFLGKPFRLEQLTAVVREMLDLPPQAGQTPEPR
ncbi:MAG: response regulator [Deltaproteobacteria bacterium]|nr:response regulator [Deltaproteobacteria bacterium]